MDVTSYLLGKKAGGGTPTVLEEKDVTVTSNGSSTINPSEGYNGIRKVNLTTSVQPNLESKSITISTNTTTTIQPTQGKDGLSSVEVTTAVPQPSGKITITENGTDIDVSSYATADVSVGGGIEEKDVNFYDAYGNLVYSYTKADFLELSEMPANPEVQGLTATGWNFTLAQAKEQLTTYKLDELDVGQEYTSNDGSVQIYITIDNDNYKSPYLNLEVESNQTCEIDWGDGSTHDTVAGGSQSIQHTYSTTGSYVIKLVTSNYGLTILGAYNSSYNSPILTDGNNANSVASCVYQGYIRKIIGNGYLALYPYACKNLYNLEYVINFRNLAGQSSSGYTFYNCYKLKYLCFNFRSFIGTQSCAYCYDLKNVVIGKNAKYDQYNLNTTPDKAFTNCKSLKRITLPVTSDFSALYNNTFQYSGIEKLKVTKGNQNSGLITNMTYLKEFDFRETTIGYLAMNVLKGCYYLEKVYFSNISSIGNNNNDSPYVVFDLTKCTAVPTGTSTMFTVPPKAIVVPDSLYEDWIVTQYWSNYANIIFKQSEYYS